MQTKQMYEWIFVYWLLIAHIKTDHLPDIALELLQNATKHNVHNYEWRNYIVEESNIIFKILYALVK